MILVLAVSAIAVALVGVTLWVGSRVLIVKDELVAAQGIVGTVGAQVTGMDFDGARTSFERADAHAANAAAAANDPVWRLGEAVPVIGHNLSVARDLADAAELLVDSLRPLVQATEQFEPGTLIQEDGSISLAPFAALSTATQEATTGVGSVAERLSRVDTTGTVEQLVTGRTQMTDSVSKLLPALDALNQVAPVLPTLLGGNGPQTYVVMFQNNAEARSLGGSALFFAEVSVDAGRIALNRVLPAGSMNFRNDGSAVVTPPEGFEALAPGVFGRFIANATSRPSFTSAAEIVMGNWAREYGTQPNAVISIDAVALSYLLRATGPVALPDGSTLTSENSTTLLLNSILQANNTGDVERDNLAQDAIYAVALQQVFGSLSTGAADPAQLILAATQALSERRVFFWSAVPEVDAALTAVGLDNGIPDSDETTDRIGFYINENVGSKLSFYLTTALQAATAGCTEEGQLTHRLDLTLTNVLTPQDAPLLSPSILGWYETEKLDPGVQRIIVYAYAPTNGRITGASVDGSPRPVDSFTDDGHPVQKFVVTIEPGASSVLSIDVATTGAPGRTLDTVVTPGVMATTRTEGALDCATLAAGG